MSYFFTVEGNDYVLENYWFSDVCLILFCNGKEIFRVIRDDQMMSNCNSYNVDTPDGSLTISPTSKFFYVDIEVFDHKKRIIPIKKIRRNLLYKIRHSKLSFKWPQKNKLNLAFFLAEWFGIALAVWLFFEGNYLEAFFLFLLSLVSLAKINYKS